LRRRRASATTAACPRRRASATTAACPRRRPIRSHLDGAYFTVSGHTRPKFGHYRKADGTFPEIPEDIRTTTYTTADGREELISQQYAEYLAHVRDGTAPSDDRSILFDGS
jgi:hypothetical protein